MLARARPLAGEAVPVSEAYARVTASAVRAAVDLPPFRSSAMDGYAVRAADVPGRLPVVDRIAAGRPAERDLGAGEAMAISTGGVVPDGADSVVPIEYVVQMTTRSTWQELFLLVRMSARAAVMFPPATSWSAPACGSALRSSARSRLRVSPRSRAFVARASSFSRPAASSRSPGEGLRLGQVYDSNGLMLAAALAAEGAEIEELPAVADDESAPSAGARARAGR